MVTSFSAAADLRLLDPFWREAAERTVLPNGLTLILKPDRSAALASVQVWVKTGSIHEGGNLGAGLSHYLEGLDHKFSAQGLRVVTVKPGFVKTGMTAGLPVPPFAGEPEGVAKAVLAAIERGRPVVYTPRAWALIMFVIRLLPRFVMRKLNF